MLVPIGKAAVRRTGDDLTIVTYASTVRSALTVADVMADEGMSVEVIDLRTLIPLDIDDGARLGAQDRQGAGVHEDNLTGGFGAEVAAVIAEHAFEYLDAPVRRLAALDTPIPFAPVLEQEYLPTEEDLLAAALDLAAY